MSEGLVEDVLRRLDAEEKLPAEVSELVLASLLGEVEDCLGGRAPERPSPGETAVAEPARAYVDAIEVEGFRGIGPRATLDLAPGPGLTLVVGRNGSGKSSFAEALELLLTGDNQRWSARGKIWREGWRNLHAAGDTRLVARLLLDGEPGPYVVSRTWSSEQALDDGEATVTHDGDASPITTLGWKDPLATYRPFLSYNELGSMLEEGPSKLFDALASILGLEELVEAAEALKQARTTRSKAHKAVKDRLKSLRAELEDHGDERAEKCLALLKGKSWKLEELEALVAGDGAPADDTELAGLQKLSRLSGPDPEAAGEVGAELGAALSEREAVAGTDAEKARRLADVLEGALEIHAHHGDGDCPVCGSTAALTAAWRKSAEEEVRDLREKAAAVDAAVRRLAAAEKRARSLATPAPDAVSEAALPSAGAVAEAWTRWTAACDAPGAELAERLEPAARTLAEALAKLQAQAREEIEKRENVWRPVALSLAAWLPGARKVQTEADVLERLKAAEDWVRTTATTIRNERFLPIKERVRGIWELLRTRSHVELEDVTFEGKSTSRRVSLDVKVDGTTGAALGVMSQGELHSLALALFLPRATVAVSPFRFLAIDDPVQSMDPARVDGLARVLEEVARDRQVLVFTHDDRLPEAARRLGVQAQVIEVLRREKSVVELRTIRSPVRQYLDDAFALAKTRDLPKIVAERVLPGLCRSALEAACIELVRGRRLGRGEPHDDVEALLGTHTKLVPRLALALFDDPDRGSDVYQSLDNRFGPWSSGVVRECNTGAHKGLAVDNPVKLVRNVETLADGILALS